MPTPTAQQVSKRFRAQLASQEAATVERMATIYNRIYTGLKDDITRLSVDIAAMDSPNREDIMKLTRMESILAQVKEQVLKFGGTVQDEIAVIQSQAVAAGVADALKLMEVSLPPLPDGVLRQITGSFVRLPTDAIEQAAGLTGRDSPLTQRLEELYGDYVAEQVGNHIVDGLAAGKNPREIDRLLQKNVLAGLGSGLTSALTTIRTAQIKSYQLANHATYLANSNIVKGWTWHSALDNRTCLSCISMHGSTHELDETLDSHHNCRCAALPTTITYADMGLDIPEVTTPIETGQDWFSRQSAATQRELMGGAMYAAYKDGAVKLGDLSRPYTDPVYGELLREASLKDILGDRAREYYAR